jgi:hypothetical protein
MKLALALTETDPPVLTGIDPLTLAKRGWDVVRQACAVDKLPLHRQPVGSPGVDA